MKLPRNGWFIAIVDGERAYFKLANGSPYPTEPPGSERPKTKQEAGFQMRLGQLKPGYYDDNLKPVKAE